MNRLSSALPTAVLLTALTLSGQTVRFETNVGNINVQLLPADAPKTVANFLQYLNSGAFNGSFIHRSVSGFVFQGGGFTWSDSAGPVAIPSNPPVVNEFKISNTRGTIAMAKLGSDPNSATSQWFFNEGDNSGNLDNQNGGFTVFGRVSDADSLAVMDAIAGEPTYDASGTFGSDFTDLPLVNYDGVNFSSKNLVVISSIVVVPAIGANGVIAASDFGGASAAAVGSFIEIYGTNLAGTTRMWHGSDFNKGKAPTTLDGVTATVGGKPAYINFVSPGQVNVQVPSGVSTGGSAAVVVNYKSQSAAPATLTIEPLAGAIFAPAAFKVNGKQYVGAYHVNGTPITNGNIHGLPAAPAVPGETVQFYGLGFGPVTSGAAITGQLATGQTKLSTPVQFFFGDQKLPGTVLYQGLAPGFVGLYQFNVTIPATAPSGDVAVHVSQGTTALPQTLYIAVK
jgi:peptidyl-prolyl cis-trans isomerase A (cyclophilin A)